MSRKALIVEDEKELGELLGEHLRAWDFEPTILNEGKSAVAWVRENAKHAVRGNHDHGAAQNVAVAGRTGYKYLTGVTRPLTRERRTSQAMHGVRPTVVPVRPDASPGRRQHFTTNCVTNAIVG